MFVHKRNLLYKEQGLVPDMLCISMWGDNGYREFENMNVTDGGADKLTSVLETGRVKTVCVHFLNPYLWSVLENYLDEINLIVWSHGSDIQPWHRRMFNYKTDADIENAKKASVTRENLWKEVFEYSEKHNIHFVYVSEFFKKQIEEDYNVDLDGRCSIIHNCIDTELFSYEKKSPEQRFNIMSVKSFSTLTYANDITQKAIEILSHEKEFSQMTFDLYGDGERFETDTANIKKFPNVHLHRGFYTQSQIAQFHKKHGIYIATTRMDTQGVSRDEAMSSGLVPVANAVAAIPEFVNEDCGILAPAEDAQAVADGILKLVRNPELFMQMSENAAAYVRNKTAEEYTISKEIALIESRRNEK
jgi:glycosyltransferase involved in cell wall biosynthesis